METPNSLFNNSTADTDPVLGTQPASTTIEEKLPDINAQYASEIAEELGWDADSVKTKSQWAALNSEESSRLVQEEEERFRRDSVNAAINSGDIESVKNAAVGMARMSSYEEVPHAAAISAMLERLAEADVNDPSRLLHSEEFNRKETKRQIKRAILEDWIMSKNIIQEDAAKSSIYPYMFTQALSPVEAYQTREAIRALGIKPDEKNAYNFIGAVDASSYMNQFMNFIGQEEADDSKTVLDFANTLKFIDVKWKEAGVNPFRQMEIANNLKEYLPGSYTLGVLLDASALPLLKGFKALKGLGKDKLLFKATEKEATKEVANVIDFGKEDYKVIEETFGDTPKAVKATEVTSKADREVAASLGVGDRERAADTVIETLGAPTESHRPIDGTNYKYTVEPIMQPSDPFFTNLAKHTKIVLQDMAEQLSERTKIALRGSRLLSEYKRELSQWHIENFLDSTNLENSLAMSRPQIVEQLLGNLDTGSVQVGTEGDLILAVKLPNNTGDFTGTEGFKLAEKRAKATRYDYRLSPTPDGQWETTVLVNTHQGWATVNDKFLADVEGLKAEKFRTFAAGIATATSTPRSISLLESALGKMNKEFQRMGEHVQRAIKGLGKKDKELFQAIRDAEYFSGAEYSNPYLASKGVPEKVIKAHMEAQNFDRFAAAVWNKQTRDYGVSIGAKEISFNGVRIKGFSRVVSGDLNHYKDVLKSKKYVAIDNLGENWTSTEELLGSEEKLSAMYNTGYRLVEINLSPDSTVSASFGVYLLNPSSLVVNELPAFVTSYVAGGRGIYSDKAAFVKQLNMLKSTTTGNRQIVGTKTFMVDEDAIGLQETVAVLNSMRDAYIRGDRAAVEKIFTESLLSSKAKGFRSGEELLVYLRDKLGADLENIDNPFEVLQNGRLLGSYENLKGIKGIEDVAGFEGMQEMHRNSLYQALSNEAQIRKNRRTGKPLADFNWNRAMPLEAEGEIRAQLNRLMTQGTMEDFTDFFADMYMRDFKDVLVLPRGRTATPYEALTSPAIPLKEASKLNRSEKVLRAQALEARKHYNALRKTPTAVDQKIAEYSDAIMNWIEEGYEKLPLTEDIKHGARLNTEKLFRMPFQHFLRQYTSLWYFAGSISQLLKQSAACVYITLMTPTNGWKAIKESFTPTIAWMYSGGDRARFLKTITKHFKGNQAQINSLTNFMNSGMFDTGNVGGMFEKSTGVGSTISEKLMLPFYTGEAFNRMVAWKAAEHSLGVYGQLIDKPSKLMRVMRRAQSYFMHMDSEGISRYQRSQVFQTLAQFQSQRMRFFETVMFDRELSPAQRASLGLGTLALVGGEGMAGVGLYTWASTNLYRVTHNTEEDRAYAIENRNESLRFLARGILDYVSERAGWNVSLADMLAPEGGDLIDTILGIAELDAPATNFLGGVYNIVADLASVVKDMALGEASSDDMVFAIERLGYEGHLPSMARPFLGYLFYQNGARLNRKGELSERCNSMLQPVLYSLGFTSLDNKELQRYFTEYSVYSNYYKAVKDEVYKDFNAALNAEDPTRYYNMLWTTVKLANMPNRDKVKMLRDIVKTAKETHNYDAMERALKSQLSMQGSRGFGILQKELLKTKERQ